MRRERALVGLGRHEPGRAALPEIDRPGKLWRSLSAMTLALRDATTADADLIAWVQVEASRSGTPLGFWDLAFPGADEPRLRLIAEDRDVRQGALRSTSSGFLVAEVDGEPGGRDERVRAGASRSWDTSSERMTQVLERNGWSEAHRRLLEIAILNPAVACFSDGSPRSLDRRVGRAATDQGGGKGVAAALLRAVLDRGRAAPLPQGADHLSRRQ